MLIGHYVYLNIQKGTEKSKKKERHFKGRSIFILKRTHPIGLKNRVVLESARRQKLFGPMLRCPNSYQQACPGEVESFMKVPTVPAVATPLAEMFLPACAL